MVEGFWIVQYEGVQGNGGGVAIFMRGHVLGGDTGFIYTGTYETNERELAARIQVRNFLPEVPSVLGVKGDFELNIKGAVSGTIIKGSASLVGQAGAGIVVKLTRVSDLPA
jgi:hypothetical protein